MKETSVVNFDPSVEAHIRLGVDPRHADQMVRGTVVLPHGTGKVVRVAVFAQGEKAQEALRAGADEVGGEDLVKKIEGGWLEFDVAVATPDMMGMVGKLGRILGRRGLMPNPKAGTVTFDIERAVGEVKAGRVEFKVDKGAIIHVPVGKASFSGEALARQPRGAPGCREPGQAVRCQGHLPSDGDDREHDGPRRPGGPSVAPRRRERLTPAIGYHPAARPAGPARRTRTKTDRRRQPAPAGRVAGAPVGRRDGRGSIRRTGPPPAAAGPGTPAGTPRQDHERPPSPGRTRAEPARREECTVWQGPARRVHRARRERATREGCMPTEAKRATIAELREDLAGSTTLITTEYRGLKVREIAEIRRALRKNNVTYRVVKNRLMRIAAEQEGNAGVAPLLRGPSAIAFGSGDENVVARTVIDAVRPYKVVKVTGAVVGGRTLDVEGVQKLATLPSRDILLAQLAGAFNAPATQVAGLLAANLRNLGSLLAQVQEQKAQTGA